MENVFFEFKEKFKQQMSGTAIDTKFAPKHVCIFMRKTETNSLKNQQNTPLVWFHDIDVVFFVWIDGED